MTIPSQTWHPLHPDSPLLAEIGNALRAAGFTEPPIITRKRDEYDVSYAILVGKVDKTVTLHCGHEKSSPAVLAAQIVSLFKQS